MACLNRSVNNAIVAFCLRFVRPEGGVRMLEEVFASPFKRPVVGPADFVVADALHRIVNAERQREGQLIGGYPIHIGGCEPGVGYDLQNEPPVEIINPPMEKFIPQKKPPPQSGRGR